MEKNECIMFSDVKIHLTTHKLSVAMDLLVKSYS